MVHPALALLLFFLLAFLAFLLLRPGRGWLWRGLKAWEATERVQIEDALKHLFDSEYHQRQANLQSLSGVLGVSGGKAAEILARLQGQELVREEEGGYRLTLAGRRDALRVVRIHRLWESYLSAETGLDPAAWHQRAERLEHKTSEAEAEALAARLGHPLYDPHGDPIPTIAGDLPPSHGRPLTELRVDQLAEIVHVEDEPEAIYAQLLAEGLHPGMRVRIQEITPRRITFEADAEEHVLAPVVAANLSVVLLAEDEEMAGPFDRLSALELGQSGRVVALAHGIRGPERRRLLDLGLVPGTEVAAEIRSPGGDPTGYRVRGAVIALRREQAEQIQIEPRTAGQAGGRSL
jgi:DtxR family Mn-dependent transcriptional regulator